MTTNKISIYLTAKGWSERKFAEEVGMSPQQVNRYVRGINKPGRVVWKRIETALPDFNSVVEGGSLSNTDIKIMAYEEAIAAKEALIQTQRETIEILRSTASNLKDRITELEKQLTRQ